MIENSFNNHKLVAISYDDIINKQIFDNYKLANGLNYFICTNCNILYYIYDEKKPFSLVGNNLGFSGANKFFCEDDLTDNLTCDEIIIKRIIE